MLGAMNGPISTAELLKGELARHFPMRAQYHWVTLQAAQNLGIVV
jgi:hypothetical protein